MRRRAFTLIELLVVVAIISLLMAVLLPALSQAREQGKGAVCLSNLHSLLLAVQMYADGNRGVFPSAGLTHGGQGNELAKSWIVQLAETYGRQTAIVRCPSDRSSYWGQPLPDGRRRQTSFCSNSYMTYKIAGRPPYERLERIRNTPNTIFWAELVEEDVNRQGYPGADHVHPESWWFGEPRQLASEQLQLERHSKSAHYGMVDGHASRLSFEQTYRLDPAGGFPPKFLTNKYDPAIAQ